MGVNFIGDFFICVPHHSTSSWKVDIAFVAKLVEVVAEVMEPHLYAEAGLHEVVKFMWDIWRGNFAQKHSRTDKVAWQVGVHLFMLQQLLF